MEICISYKMQAFTPGGCYSPGEKYCPHLVTSCLNPHNKGYNWTLQGDLSRLVT